MKKYLFFDHASTTKCSPEAAQLMHRFGVEDYGNPSSAHAFGMTASGAIQEARTFFANTFKVKPNQIVFTGSGSESDNLAIYGVAMADLTERLKQGALAAQERPRVLFSAIEHAAVRKTAQSLEDLGFEPVAIPVSRTGHVEPGALESLLTPNTRLVSIMQVNNVVGSIQPIDDLARFVRAKAPKAIFHCDAVQSFGKLPTLTSHSAVDLISISAHKLEGPKGVGALIVLNPALMKKGLRPVIWGGDQEGGLRSGTPNAGLIAAFHAAAKEAMNAQHGWMDHMATLHRTLHDALDVRNLLGTGDGQYTWNSPLLHGFAPHIINLSLPSYPGAALASLLEQRGCLVSMGSACSTGKPEPDPVLTSMGLRPKTIQGAIRVSFSKQTTVDDIAVLAEALEESALTLRALFGASARA